MKQSSSDRELMMFRIIAESDRALGSWALTNLFNERGIEVSQATIGRMLNSLESRGFLRKCDGNQGRVLTEKGREFLAIRNMELKFDPYYKKLREMINAGTLKKFIMVLEARRAIERATVRAAVRNITDEQIGELGRIVSLREEALKKSQSIYRYDIEFHQLIAEASGNEVLSLLYQTVATQGQQSPLFEYIRRRVPGKYSSSHIAILEAIRAKDEDLAEARIIEHIDSLIGDVNQYWHEHIG